MKLISKYFFMTLVIIQVLFIGLWYTNINLLGILSWIGKGDSYNSIKLFSPLLAFGLIKICYWIANPLSKLYTILLNWALIFGIFYLLYWVFFL
jgi:hypothetical protein